MTIQIRRTLGTVPPDDLRDGELAVEMTDTPRPRLWVGAPAVINANRRVQINAAPDLSIYAPIDSPALTGNPRVSNALDQEFGIAATRTVGVHVGRGNNVRNGAFEVWQRGPGPFVVGQTPEYTADGWAAWTNTGSVTVERAEGHEGGEAQSSLQITANNPIGDHQCSIVQPIESAIGGLMPQSTTCAFQLYNGTGAIAAGISIPQLHWEVYDAPDSGVVAEVAGPFGLRPCPPDVWTMNTYTIPGQNYMLRNGFRLRIDFSNLGAAGRFWRVSEFFLIATPAAGSGLNFNYPIVNFRPIGADTEFCQRYFWRPPTPLAIPADGALLDASCADQRANFILPVEMRVNPTITANWSNLGALADGGITALADNRTIQGIASNPGLSVTGIPVMNLTEASAELPL